VPPRVRAGHATGNVLLVRNHEDAQAGNTRRPRPPGSTSTSAGILSDRLDTHYGPRASAFDTYAAGGTTTPEVESPVQIPVGPETFERAAYVHDHRRPLQLLQRLRGRCYNNRDVAFGADCGEPIGPVTSGLVIRRGQRWAFDRYLYISEEVDRPVVPHIALRPELARASQHGRSRKHTHQTRNQVRSMHTVNDRPVGGISDAGREIGVARVLLPTIGPLACST
jgi:hypothetical protein